MTDFYYSVDNLARANRAAGGHWFDNDTMRFFGTRICAGRALFGNRAFVTSELVWGEGARSYAVRVLWDPSDPCGIDTLGDRFASLSSATRWAERVGKLSPERWAYARQLRDQGTPDREAVRIAESADELTAGVSLA